jgi:hypothetical protein
MSAFIVVFADPPMGGQIFSRFTYYMIVTSIFQFVKPVEFQDQTCYYEHTECNPEIPGFPDHQEDRHCG